MAEKPNPNRNGNEANLPMNKLNTSALSAPTPPDSITPTSTRASTTSGNVTTAVPTPSLEVLTIAKPHSKTAIGRLTQKVKKLPLLHVAELALELRTAMSWAPVTSRKLMRRVVSQLLEKQLVEYRQSTSVDYSRDIDNARLIIRIPDEAKKVIVKGRLNLLDGTLIKVGDEKLMKDGIELTVRCKIRDPSGDQEVIYEQSLNFLLRQTFKELGSDIPLPSTQYEANLFDPLLLGCNRAATWFLPSDYKLYVRSLPSIDVKGQQLMMDLDVIPCVPAKPLYDVLIDMTGQTGVAAPDAEVTTKWLPEIKRSLLGMHVRCGYIPSVKTQNSRDKARILRPEELLEGRRFQIRDLSMSSDVETFNIGAKTYTVYEYFQNVVLPKTSTLDDKLPLVQDSSGGWIPIELLFIDGPQHLTHYGHLNKMIQGKTRKFLEHGGLAKISGLGADLMKAINNGTVQEYALDTDGLAEFTLNPSLSIQLTAEHAIARRKPEQLIARVANIAIVYVHTLTGLPADTTLVQGVTHGLSSFSGSVNGHVIHLKPKLDSGTNTVNDSGDQMNRRIRLEMPRIDSQMIFAIVDDCRQSKADTQNILAKLRQFSDLESGVPLVCSTTSHLMRLFKGRLSASERYFPASLRMKINCKLGGTNVATNLGHVPKTANLMIIGAHTAHQYGTKFYCPSVSAVVASTDATGVQYLGSSQIHTTTTFELARNGSNTRCHKSTIASLDDMMVNRFKAWKTSQSPPTHLLFFYDSVDLKNARGQCESYCTAVINAFDTVFPHNDSPAITYVVVNKNSRTVYKHPQQTNDDTEAPFDYLAEGADQAKYRYYVLKNDVGWKKADLASLTRSINISSQLCTREEPSTMAYPVKLATKLTKRVHDYFRHDMKDEIPRPKRVTFDIQEYEQSREQFITAKLHQDLGIGGSEEDVDPRCGPWKDSLNTYMFYL